MRIMYWLLSHLYLDWKLNRLILSCVNNICIWFCSSRVNSCCEFCYTAHILTSNTDLRFITLGSTNLLS